MDFVLPRQDRTLDCLDGVHIMVMRLQGIHLLEARSTSIMDEIPSLKMDDYQHVDDKNRFAPPEIRPLHRYFWIASNPQNAAEALSEVTCFWNPWSLYLSILLLPLLMRFQGFFMPNSPNRASSPYSCWFPELISFRLTTSCSISREPAMAT